MLRLLLLVTGTPELTKESYVALERMALSVSVLNGASSGSSLGVPGHGHLMKVWQVALRKNTESGPCGRCAEGDGSSKLELNCSLYTPPAQR